MTSKTLDTITEAQPTLMKHSRIYSVSADSVDSTCSYHAEEIIPKLKKNKTARLSKNNSDLLPSKRKPKRPLSAYNIFFREERARIILERQSKTPDTIIEDKQKTNHCQPHDNDNDNKARKVPHRTIDFSSLGKLIAANWKTVSPEILRRCKDIARQDGERYKQDKHKYEREKENYDHKCREIKSAFNTPCRRNGVPSIQPKPLNLPENDFGNFGVIADTSFPRTFMRSSFRETSLLLGQTNYVGTCGDNIPEEFIPPRSKNCIRKKTNNYIKLCSNKREEKYSVPSLHLQASDSWHQSCNTINDQSTFSQNPAEKGDMQESTIQDSPQVVYDYHSSLDDSVKVSYVSGNVFNEFIPPKNEVQLSSGYSPRMSKKGEKLIYSSFQSQAREI